jgi:hypothetical protein
MTLHIGDKIKTNYSHREYIVESIARHKVLSHHVVLGCGCPSLSGCGPFILSDYNEQTLTHLTRKKDKIIILESNAAGAQQGTFRLD